MVFRPRTHHFRRPRGHSTRCRPRRPDRRAVGGAGTVAAAGEEGGSAAEVDQTSTHRRHPVADPCRDTMAGRAGPLWPVADGVRPVPPVATQRNLAHNPGPAPGFGRRGRPDHLGRVGGLHHRPGPPARRGCSKKGTYKRNRQVHAGLPNQTIMRWAGHGAG
jgi:hypothetical protein